MQSVALNPSRRKIVKQKALLIVALILFSCRQEKFIHITIANVDPSIKKFNVTAVFRPTHPPCDGSYPTSMFCRNSFEWKKPKNAQSTVEFNIPLPEKNDGLISFDVTASDDQCATKSGRASGQIVPSAFNSTVTVPLKACSNCWCDYYASEECNDENNCAFIDIKGISENDIWAVGEKGVIMHWDGATWSRERSNTDYDINSLAIVQKNDIWAVGGTPRHALSGIILHWDGNKWSSVRETEQILYNIRPATPDSFSIVGGCGTENGSATGGCAYSATLWKDGRLIENTIPQNIKVLKSVWRAGFSGNIFAVGGIGALGTGDPNRQCPRSPNEIGRVFQRNSSTENAWSNIPLNFPDQTCNLNWIWGSAENDIWSVGDYGSIIHWNGVAWEDHTSRFEAVTHRRNLWQVWGSGPADVWAVGGSRLRSAPEKPGAGIIIHWTGTSLTVVEFPGTTTDKSPPYKNAIWGANQHDVWAVGYGLSILRYRK